MQTRRFSLLNQFLITFIGLFSLIYFFCIGGICVQGSRMFLIISYFDIILISLLANILIFRKFNRNQTVKRKVLIIIGCLIGFTAVTLPASLLIYMFGNVLI